MREQVSPKFNLMCISVIFLTFVPNHRTGRKATQQGFPSTNMHRTISTYSAIRYRVRWLSRVPALLSVALVLALSLSCNESLPPYDIPATLFTGTIRPMFVRTQGTHLWVILKIENTFDETLQDVPSLTGRLEIILARDPSIHKTVTLDSRNLLYHYNALLGYPNYANIPNLTGGILTINSRDSVRFFYDWTFTSDDSLYLPTKVFHMHEDPRYPGNFMADPETFILRAYVQVFTKTGLVIFEPVNYVLNFYQPS